MKAIYFKKGQTVDIPNATPSGKPIIEGKAKLIEFVGKGDYPPYPETWKVRFPGEDEIFTRTLIPPEDKEEEGK